MTCVAAMPSWVASRRGTGTLRQTRTRTGTQEGAQLRQVMIGIINSATMLATLIIGLMAGPAVSL